VEMEKRGGARLHSHRKIYLRPQAVGVRLESQGRNEESQLSDGGRQVRNNLTTVGMSGLKAGVRTRGKEIRGLEEVKK